jgi:AcrR family transcriptional regulator
MVYKLKRRPSRKAELYDAAAKLVAEQGAEALTFDGLAKAAGVTKAGVQYHFASKDQMLEDVLEHLLAEFDAVLEAAANEKPKPGSWLRAYVSLTAWPQGHYDAAVATLLAWLPPGDERGAAYRQYTDKWRIRAANDGVEPGIAQAVRLAADALWLERMFGGANDAEAEAVRKTLFKLIEDNSR